jgi:hypothetical protein
MKSSNINDLLEKIDWEEGISSAVMNGLTDIDDYDVPDDLKDIWEEMAANILMVNMLMDHYYREYDTYKEF